LLVCLETLDFVVIGLGRATALGSREPSAQRSRWLGRPEESALRVGLPVALCNGWNKGGLWKAIRHYRAEKGK
jgi:hypothetical protein